MTCSATYIVIKYIHSQTLLSFLHWLLKEQLLTGKMIIVDTNLGKNNEHDDDDDDWASAFDFILPECKLPDFLDTTMKWHDCVLETYTLHLWCDLMTKIETYSPLYISEEDVKIVISCLLDDIVYMYGITTFFPTGPCEECGIIHSVCLFFPFYINYVFQELSS